MPTRRAVLAAAVPGIVVWAVFWLWMKMPLLVAATLGVLWGIGSLIVTRYLYDDAEGELDAWRVEAPDLAGPVSDPEE